MCAEERRQVYYMSTISPMNMQVITPSKTILCSKQERALKNPPKCASHHLPVPLATGAPLAALTAVPTAAVPVPVPVGPTVTNELTRGYGGTVFVFLPAITEVSVLPVAVAVGMNTVPLSEAVTVKVTISLIVTAAGPVSVMVTVDGCDDIMAEATGQLVTITVGHGGHVVAAAAAAPAPTSGVAEVALVTAAAAAAPAMEA